MNSASAMARRSAALGVLFAVVACAALLGWFSWSTYWQNEALLAERNQIYDRLRGIASYQLTSESAKSDTIRLAQSRLFLGDGTPAVIVAGLQARLQEYAAGDGVNVLQMGESAPVSIAGVSYLGVHVEAQATLRGLHGFLRQIESSRPLLFIEGLTIRADPSAGPQAETEPFLNAGFDVYGPVSVPAASGATP